MGKVLRQSLFTTFFSYLGVIIGYFNLLWLMPYVLQPEELGLYRFVQDFAILLMPFAQLGFGQAFLKFHPEFKDKKGLLTQFLGFTVLAFLLFLILFLAFKQNIIALFSDQSPEVLDYLPLVMALTCIMALAGVLEYYCRSVMQIILPNFLKEVMVRLVSSIFIFAYFLSYIELSTLVYSLLVNYGLHVLALLLFALKKDPQLLSPHWELLKGEDLKRILTFGMYAFASLGSILIVSKVDAVMISAYLGMRELAIYSIAFYISVLVELPKRALTQSLLPLISKNLNEGRMDEIAILYRKASINQFLIAMLFYLGIWVSLNSLFDLMPDGDIYRQGKYVVLIIGLGKLFDLLASINGEIILYSRYFRVNLASVATLALVTILLNVLLIPPFGLMGAAWASAISFFVFNTFKYFFVWWKFKMQPFSIATLGVLFCSALAYLGQLALPSLSSPWLDILLRSLFILVLYCIPAYAMRISPDANDFLKKLLKSK